MTSQETVAERAEYEVTSRKMKFAWIFLFTYLGVVFRLGFINVSLILTQRNPNLNNWSLTSNSFFLANSFGCFLLGYVKRWKKLSKNNGASDGLYAGICTGFCGSCTTYSAWFADVVYQYYHFDVFSTTIMMLGNFAIFTASFSLGCNVANWAEERKIHDCLQSLMDEFNSLVDADSVMSVDMKRTAKSDMSRLQTHCSTIQSHTSGVDDRPVHFRISNSKVFACVIAMFVLALGSMAIADFKLSLKLIGFALVLAPVGSSLRFLLSILNGKCWEFPFFTLLPNIIATTIAVSVATIVDIGSSSPWIQGGVLIGIMGSLSTTSTWIDEIFTLAEKRFVLGVRYMVTSIALTIALGIASKHISSLVNN